MMKDKHQPYGLVLEACGCHYNDMSSILLAMLMQTWYQLKSIQ